MSSVWSRNLKVSIFGESHGEAIGVTMDNILPGIEFDGEFIRREMKRRASSSFGELATNRKEGDEFQILSGVFNGHTTGAPLCAVIWNSDKRSSDYDEMKSIARPGHADYTGNVKYKGYNDYRGGGHFSGRLTTPLVFAGAVAKLVLRNKGISIGSHLLKIGSVWDESFDPVDLKHDILVSIAARNFPVMSDQKGHLMKEEILAAKKEQDSIGGIIEAAIVNLPPGIGSPFFDSVESVLSHLLFSIPGVKGVEFGAGFHISSMKGSEANDQFYVDGSGSVKTYTNNNGGILGGITDGMPVIFRAAFKPTSSIGMRQSTINMQDKTNTQINVKGRHDPCIVTRAVPVVEAAAAIGILDLLMCN